MSKRLKILISAYACEPGRGSEPGAGWNWPRLIARRHDVWVVTRESQRAAIERAGGAGTGVRWVYFDLPAWARWNTDRHGERLYYTLWQLGTYPIVRRLHEEVGFDVAHHLTLGVYWYPLPSVVSRLPTPFVFGPVGGGETAPRAFYRTFGARGFAYETLRDLGRWAGRMSPLVQRTARKSAIAVAKAAETAECLRRLEAPRVEVYSEAGIADSDLERLERIPVRVEAPFRLLSVGRLLHWKGFHLSLEAFARLQRRLPESEYWIVGEGPERARLERLARRLGVEGRVRFFGIVPRPEVLERLAACDVVAHPSLHDSGSSACVEAMAAGRPVLCLDIGGPALLVTEEVGVKVRPGSPEQVVADLAAAMERLARDPATRARMSEAGRRRVRETFEWERKGDWLDRVYAQVTGSGAAVAAEPPAA